VPAARAADHEADRGHPADHADRADDQTDRVRREVPPCRERSHHACSGDEAEDAAFEGVGLAPDLGRARRIVAGQLHAVGVEAGSVERAHRLDGFAAIAEDPDDGLERGRIADDGLGHAIGCRMPRA